MKAGFVGLIGMPNAGKSTLLNNIVGESVAIVTPKPQTTRGRVHGIWNSDESQIVFTDAPGYVSARGSLNKFLHDEMKSVIHDSDILCAVISLDERKQSHVDKIFDLCSESGKPWVIALTKYDLVKLRRRVPYIKQKAADCGVPVFEFSPESDWKESTFLKDFKSSLVEHLPDSAGPLYDTDMFTASTSRELIRELIREQVFLNVEQEIPYSTAVRIRKYEETEKIIKVYADILVAKDSHKAILIGKKAEMIKKMGMQARLAFEKMIGEKVYLELSVQVRPDWTENKRLMEELGYVHEKE